MHDAPEAAVLAGGRPGVDDGLYDGGDGLGHLKNKVEEKGVKDGQNRAGEAAQTQGESTAGRLKNRACMHGVTKGVPPENCRIAVGVKH